MSFLTVRCRVVSRIDEIPAADWNALVEDGDPFLCHEFLSALERNGCVGLTAGWAPQHLLCVDDDGRILGAMPLYLKDNSFGEFVFDWGWADAYRRHGLNYYPKLVCAIPYTPATGRRLLLHPQAPAEAVSRVLIDGARALCERLGCSSLHCLFVDESDTDRLRQKGCLIRLGCHFHWHNDGYRDFMDFAAALKPKRRKNIRRERRLVEEAGIECRILHGSEVSEAEWNSFYRFYRNTFRERGRQPPLTLAFFQDVGARMGERVVLVLAARAGRDVAGAISYRSDTALFGRHWGCASEFDSLHFECCYYQGIDYCIGAGLRRFEPGVQGEHKVWRGFLPTLTRSAHWLEHPAFRDAVADFVRRESAAVRAYAAELGGHSPFRDAGPEHGER